MPALPAPDPGAGGLNDLSGLFRAWADTFPLLGDLPEHLAPRWLVEQADDLGRRVRAMAELPTEHFVHWDIRNDNILQRSDGSIVFVGWGQAAVDVDLPTLNAFRISESRRLLAAARRRLDLGR